MRVFFGIEPGAEQRERLRRGCGELRRRWRDERLRWLSPESYHMTLAFVGELPGGDLPALLQAAEHGLAGAGPECCEAAALRWLPDDEASEREADSARSANWSQYAVRSVAGWVVAAFMGGVTWLFWLNAHPLLRVGPTPIRRGRSSLRVV